MRYEPVINLTLSALEINEMRKDIAEFARFDIDADALRILANSSDFRNEKYAFFFYNEVRRLLGMPIKGNAKQMSGLLPAGETL